MNVVMPGTAPHGFVDAHVHIQSPAALTSIREAGVVAVRDAGLRHNAEPVQGCVSRSGAGISVVSAGWALYRKGGYGHRFGVPVANREEIASEIARLKTAGAGIIKIMASGIVHLQAPGVVTTGGFAYADLQFIVGCASDVGLCVMAHANGDQAIVDGVRAGVRSIEHGFFMTERAVDLMAERGVFWVPTVGALARAVKKQGGPRRVPGYIEKLLHAHRAMISKAHAAGVLIAVGTDRLLPGAEYRASYEEELDHFRQAGLSRKETEKIACDNGRLLLAAAPDTR